MPETRTDVVVNAKARGFKDIQSQAGKLADQATKLAASQSKGYQKLEAGTKSYRKEVKSLEKDLRELAKAQLATVKAMAGIDKGTQAYEKLGKSLKALNAESAKARQQLGFAKTAAGPDRPSGPMQPAGAGGLKAEDLARHGFMQGLLLGFAPNVFQGIQRGPGMWRQAAGQTVGTMASGVMGAPFSGLQGLQNAMSSMGKGGAFAASQLGNLMQYAQGAFGVQQTRLEIAPHLGLGGVSRRATKAAEEAMSGVLNPAQIGKLGEARRDEVANKFRIEELKDVLAKKPGATTDENNIYTRAANKVREEGLEKNLTKTYLDATKNAEAKKREVLTGPFNEIKKAGQEILGVSEQQALQAISPVLRGGGGYRSLQENNMIQASFAAQRAYGVGPETSAAFQQAGRTGGAVGAIGRGGEAMADVIADGFKMGLDGAEIPDYVQQMAEGITSWKQTGIKVNTESLGKLGATIAGTGLGGVRGANIAQGLHRAAQSVTTGGVQNQMDLMMLGAVGGYKGGGMKEYEQAMLQMEKGMDPEQMKNLVSTIMGATPNEYVGRQVVRNLFQEKGVTLQPSEMMQMQKGMFNPGAMNKDEREAYTRIQERMKEGQKAGPKGVAGMVGEAATVMGNYGDYMKKAAEIQNKQNELGEGFIGTLNDLQLAQIDVTAGFSYLGGTALKDVSEKILTFSEMLETGSKQLAIWLGTTEAAVIKSNP